MRRAGWARPVTTPLLLDNSASARLGDAALPAGRADEIADASDPSERLRRLIGQAPSLPGDEPQRLLRLIADEFPDPAITAEARAALARTTP